MSKIWLRKEEIWWYVQQGRALPGWQILRPRARFMGMRAALFACVALILAIGATQAILASPFSGNTVLLFLLPGGLSVFASCRFLVQVLDLFARPEQALVLMPEGFYLKMRRSDHLIHYSQVSSIVPRWSRSLGVFLYITSVETNAMTRIELDNHYGDVRKLGAQIVEAQRRVKQDGSWH